MASQWVYRNGRFQMVAPQGQSAGSPVTQTSQQSTSGVAKQVSNVGTNGSDARFFVGPNSGLRQVGDHWVDANGSVFDSNGLWTGQGPNPTQYIPGLPPANQSESYNVYTGQTTGGGGSAPAGGPTPQGGVSDPFYNQMKSFLQAQSAGDLANTKAAIQKALIAYGLVPATGFDDKLGALDEATKNLVAKNTESGISYYARLLEQKRDNLRSINSRLSASGLRRSGAKGYKLRRSQLDADRAFQDSLSELLGQIGNMYSGYAGNEANRQMQLLQALQNSQGNFWSGAGSSVGGSSVGGGGGSLPLSYLRDNAAAAAAPQLASGGFLSIGSGSLGGSLPPTTFGGGGGFRAM